MNEGRGEGGGGLEAVLFSEEGFFENGFEGLADGFDLAGGHLAEEGEREGTSGDVFADGEVAGFEAELSGDVGLEMDGREVVAAADEFGAELSDDGIASVGVEEVAEANDEDEPAHEGIFGDGGEDEITAGHEAVDVEMGDAAAVFEEFVESVHLSDADGGIDFAEAVVVAESFVREPGHSFAALVSECTAGGGEAFVVGEDHAAFAGGDLFIGVESEDAGAPEGADGAFAGASAEAFAGVFDEDEFVFLGELFDFDHSAGVAEGFDGDDGLGIWGEGGFEFGEVDIEVFGVDIDEDGFSADVEDAIGGGDEGEGGGDDFVAGLDAGGDHGAMEAGGAGGDADGVLASDAFCAEGFEFLDFGADGEGWGGEDVDDGVDFASGDVGLGEGDGSCHR